MLAPLAGTFWVMVMTAIMTIPVGIATAVYLEEFAPDNRVTRLIQLNIFELGGRAFGCVRITWVSGFRAVPVRRYS